MQREDQFVLDTQDAARQVWDGLNTLLRLQREWTYRNFTTTLEPALTLTTHPAVADLSAVVFTTADALNAALAAGHGTNLTKVL